MSRKALVLLVCCCDFRDGAERLMPSKSLGNAVIRAFPGLFRILRMCAPRRAAAVVRPRGREKSADRRRRILISRLLIIRASVPRRKSPFPAYFKGFPAVSLLIPPYPAFLKYPVSPQQLNEAWFAKAQQALDKLFSDLGDHIVLRDIQPWWYSLLPALPGDRPWTPLLLQSILGFYSKKLGNAKTICGMASQSKDTLHAMLVSGSSEVQTFSDAVAAWYVDDGITGKRFQAEDLRELLVKRGLLAGSELYGRLHKALANDPRFAWSADNTTVTINL